MNHVQGDRVEFVINHLSYIQVVGVESFVPFKNDSPEFIGGTAHMRAKLKFPPIKILNIKLRWISYIFYMRVRDKRIGRAPINGIVPLLLT
jgi:hypothetical protein